MRWICVCVALAGCGDDAAEDPTPNGSTSEASEPSASTTNAMTAGPGGSSSEGSTMTAATPDPSSSSTDPSGSSGSTSTGGCVDPSGDGVEEVTSVQTPDDKTLAGTFYYPETGRCLPALLLVHQYTLDRSQWLPQIEPLVGAGYVVLTIDLRGHGESDPQDGPLTDLLSDPDQAPVDVATALDALAAHPSVDSDRVGAIGTSIGANLVVVAMTQDQGVQAVAALSPRLTAVEALAGGPAAVSDINCYAGELDSGGDQAETCTDLVAAATGTAVENILPGTGAHGVAILQDFPEVTPDLIEWFDAVL